MATNENKKILKCKLQSNIKLEIKKRKATKIKQKY